VSRRLGRVGVESIRQRPCRAGEEKNRVEAGG